MENQTTQAPIEKKKYVLTDTEFKIVSQAIQQINEQSKAVQTVVGFLAQSHGIEGEVVLSPDGSTITQK